MSQFSRSYRWFAGHARRALTPARAPVPWPHMLVCGSAATLPTLAGFYAGELRLAIYGGLIGYLMALNDHFGALPHRILISTLSLAALGAAFVIGVNLQDSPHVFLGVMAVLTYWLGLMGGTGAEAERLLLFALIELVVTHYAVTITPMMEHAALPYGLLAFATLITGQIASDRFARSYRVVTFARLGPSVRESITRQVSRHRYAANYTLAVILAIAINQRFAIERGYWMIITVLLVMRPEFRDGLYRQAQRLVGTLLGVLIGDLLILTIDVKALLIAGVFLSACAVPFALKRNYWLVSFFATIMVVLFLTLPVDGPPGIHVPFVRLLATTYGCLLSGAVSVISVGLVRLVKPRGRQT